MNQIKRQLNEDVLSNTKTKQIRKSRFDKNEPTTCIEYLSNEIFYEIFDYLDGYDIFYAFSNLNIRFHHLVNYSSLSIKIYRSTSSNHISDAHYQQFLIANRHRVISFYIHDKSQMLVSSSLLSINCALLFNRLESIVLDKIHCNIIIPLLWNLTNLPRLFSLKIDVSHIVINFTELYSLILNLPVLKYIKVSASGLVSSLDLPYNTDKFSPIEQLIMHSPCKVNELLTIISYTPHLSHLTCNYLQAIRPIRMTLLLNTSNLKYFFLNDCHLKFDQFEILIKNLFSQIQVLRLVISSQSLYIDPDRWERLILQYMPHLRILNLKYSEIDLSTLRAYHYRLSRFISSFWAHRKWFLELQFCTNIWSPTKTICFIRPLKKQWYELQDDVNVHQMVTYSTLDEQKCIDTSFSHLHLIITYSQLSEHYRLFEEYVRSILDLVQFTSLRIDLYQFSISGLIQFLYLLPNLDALTITSEYPETTKILSKEQNNMFHFVSTHNKITKLSLEQMTELDQVHILMDLCPHMHNFQVKCRNIIDAEWLIRYVLTKRNKNFIPYLSSLCIWFSTTDDKMTNNLQTIIDTEKLVDNYTINRICNRIYLRWN